MSKLLNKGISRFLELLRFRSRKLATPIILVGADYSTHCVSSLVLEGNEFEVVAIIDDEPWTHRTIMNGAVIHYPGELLALIERSGAQAVVSFEKEGYMLEHALIVALAASRASYIQVPEELKTPTEKLNYIRSLIT